MSHKHLPHTMNPIEPSLDGSNISFLPLSPGQKLRAAREKAALSVEEVASLLFLHVDFIGYLENDQYDALPGPTFVKGYLKAYARLVNVPSDNLIALYNESHAAQAIKPAGSSKTVNTPLTAAGVDPGSALGRDEPSNRGLLSLLPHLIIVVLAIVAICWIFAQDSLPFWGKGFTLPWQQSSAFANAEPSSKEQLDNSAESKPALQENPNSPGVSASEEANITLSHENSGTTEGHSVTHYPEPESSAVGKIVDRPLESRTLLSRPLQDWGGRQLPGMVIKRVDSQSGEGASYKIELEGATLSEPQPNPNRLKLAFLETANVFVQDASGASAHDETHSRGSEVQVALFGPPPYLLSISTPEAVAVRFNDQPVVLPRAGS